MGNLAEEDIDWLGIHATPPQRPPHPHNLARPRPSAHRHRPHRIRTRDRAGVDRGGLEAGLVNRLRSDPLGRDLQRAGAIANLSNIDYVYDSDPRTNPNAKRRENMTWAELQGIVGNEWSPGMNAPFDPIATKLAGELGLTVGIINGHDLPNVARFLHNQPFTGTTIRPAILPTIIPAYAESRL